MKVLQLQLAFKRILFPGLNIGTRKRLTFTRYFKSGNIATLDAGCGNGAFAFFAYNLGNRVLGINISGEDIRRCEQYRDYLGIDPVRCQFKTHNIYDVLALNRQFDQIICFETLEHLKHDEMVLGLFRKILGPDGILHICTPRNNRKPLFGEAISEEEDGGHVRIGYSFEMLEKILHRHGFVVTGRDSAIGFVSQKIEEALNWVDVTALQHFPGLIRQALHAGFFLLLYPLTFLDELVPSLPLTIYVQARVID